MRSCVQTSFCNDALTQWRWFRSQQPGAEDHTEQQNVHGRSDGFFAIQGAEQRLYTPAEADAGQVLMVECTPASRCAL